MAQLSKADLTPEIRKLLGLPTNSRRFTKEDVRSYALRCLAPLAGLNQGQRKRVLGQALKVNEA